MNALFKKMKAFFGAFLSNPLEKENEELTSSLAKEREARLRAESEARIGKTRVFEAEMRGDYLEGEVERLKQEVRRLDSEEANLDRNLYKTPEKKGWHLH